MKPAIIILSSIGIVGFIVGYILLLAGFFAIATSCQSVVNDQTQFNACLQANAAAGIGQIVGGVILMIIAGLCSFVAYVLGIIKTVTLKEWGWFVAVLLASPLGSLIYGIFGPFQPKQPTMTAVPSMYQPPYQQ